MFTFILIVAVGCIAWASFMACLLIGDWFFGATHEP